MSTTRGTGEQFVAAVNADRHIYRRVDAASARVLSAGVDGDVIHYTLAYPPCKPPMECTASREGLIEWMDRGPRKGEPVAERTELICFVMLEHPALCIATIAAYNRKGPEGIYESCCQTGFFGWQEDRSLVAWDEVMQRLRHQAGVFGVPLTWTEGADGR